MLIKLIYRIIDGSLYCFLGISLIEFLAINGIGHIQRIFPSLNSDLVTIGFVLGIFLSVLKIYFYYYNSKDSRKMQAELLREKINNNIKTENENNKIELENRNKELQNYLFKIQIDNINEDEFEESKKRLES
jgi:hypothetical protein